MKIDNSVKINGYIIKIENQVNLDKLKKNWQYLQGNKPVPFFLDWLWISTWLETYKPPVIVVSATYYNKIVALGLFTLSISYRHYLIKSRQLLLNQTGRQFEDQIWVEYNHIISSEEHQGPASNACIKALFKNTSLAVDEIVFSMMEYNRAKAIISNFKKVNLSKASPCYASNLDEIRSKDKSFIDTLKSNTRYQIRRSQRIYEAEYGKLVLTVAKNRKQAIDFFHSAGEFHKTRWNDSGFNNPSFVAFHENLINKCYLKHNVILLRIASGTTPIGYLYYQISNQSAYFYLHGLKSETNPKLKPGLVSHALASQHFIQLGFNKYDYMGGYSQYKTQLANHHEDLVTVTIQKPKVIFYIEKIARNLKFIFLKLKLHL